MREAASPPNETALDLESLAADVVALAMKAGASDAEAMARESDEFSVNVRLGQVETLQESGSRGLGLRVFLGRRSGSASTSDLTAEGIRQLVEGAMALAAVTEEDPFAGLPEPGQFGAVPGDLHLYYDDVYSLAGAERIEWARRVEAAALSADPRITNSDGGSFDASTGRRALANSRGFAGSYRTSYAGVAAAPLARDADGKMQRDAWWSSSRRLSDVESPEAVGAEAARRTLRRLGARRVPTQCVPIVFAPETARTLIGSVFEAASGDAIWRGASFLAGKLGEAIAATNLTIIDDNTMLLPTGVGGFGTSPFDGEGLPSRAHHGSGERCAAQLPAEHLHRAQAGHALDPQRRAGTRRCAGSRLRQSLLATREHDQRANPRRGEGGALRDEPDGIRHEYGHGRLLARRHRPCGSRTAN